VSLVSVIVPVHNEARYLGDCLDALLNQELSTAEYEVIVVDNGSSDRSREIVRTRDRVQLLTEPQRGAYAARNRGLQAARGELVAFTDADCVPRRDWLQRLCNAVGQDPGIQVVMGRDIPTGPSKAIRLLGLYDHAKEIFVMSSDDPSVYYGHTNCMLTRRAALEATGGFDVRPRGADVIFVQRVLQRFGTGAVCYEPDAVVNHLEVHSAWVYFRKAFIYGRSARSYRRVVRARPLRGRERWRIFGETVRSNALPAIESAYLLALLTLGVAAYSAGLASVLRTPGSHASRSLEVEP